METHYLRIHTRKKKYIRYIGTLILNNIMNVDCILRSTCLLTAKRVLNNQAQKLTQTYPSFPPVSLYITGISLQLGIIKQYKIKKTLCNNLIFQNIQNIGEQLNKVT